MTTAAGGGVQPGVSDRAPSWVASVRAAMAQYSQPGMANTWAVVSDRGGAEIGHVPPHDARSARPIPAGRPRRCACCGAPASSRARADVERRASSSANVDAWAHEL